MSSETMDLNDGEDNTNATNPVQPPPSSSTNESRRSTGRKRKPPSGKKDGKKDIWESFEKYKVSDNVWRARCIHCRVQTYAIGDGSKSHGTTNLTSHVEKQCFALHNKSVNQMHMDHEGKLRSKKFSQEIYREKVAISIIKHNYPFSKVEHEGDRDVHVYLNSDVKPYTRNTAKADVLKIYMREMAKVKDIIANAPGRICLTSDLWSSLVSEGYLCLTAHFVDEKWQLRSFILNFCHCPPPHNGFFLSENLLSRLKEWGIEQKIFTLTLDNASANGGMQDKIKSQLRNSLLLDGDFFHVRCCAHILNLIVQDGLKVASDALFKIRESDKYLKWSEARKIKFVSCCVQTGCTSQSGLRQDMPIRWNSTHKMLQVGLYFQKAFDQLAMVDARYKTCPTSEEWTRAKKMATFLEPFAEITTLFSGSQYPTANLYLQNIWKIQCHLLKEFKGRDDIIREMCKGMLPKFHKYWDDYSHVLCMAIILDPRYKVEFVSYCYKRVESLIDKL